VRLGNLKEALSKVKANYDDLALQLPEEYSVGWGHLPWLTAEGPLTKVVEALNESIDKNLDMSVVTTLVSECNTLKTDALEAGLKITAPIVEHADEAMMAGHELNEKRKKAEESLRLALQVQFEPAKASKATAVPAASRIRKVLREAQCQSVFEKVLMEARIHEKNVLNHTCVHGIKKAIGDADWRGLPALIQQADDLTIQDDIVQTAREHVAAAEQDGQPLIEVAEDGNFLKEGGPFGTVTWRNNLYYELVLPGDEDEGRQVDVDIFVTDTQEHGSMHLHVCGNDAKVEDMLLGYNHFLLPGFTVEAEQKGMHMVRISMTLTVGKRYYLVPSLVEELVVEAAPDHGRRVNPVGFVESSRPGTYRISAAAFADLKLTRCGLDSEEWAQYSVFDDAWSSDEKSAGGPRGSKEPNRMWYRNTEYRIYNGSSAELDLAHIKEMENQSSEQIEKVYEARKSVINAHTDIPVNTAPRRSSLAGGTQRASVALAAARAKPKKPPRAWKERTVFCVVLKASSAEDRGDQVPAETCVIRNNDENEVFKNVFASVMTNAVNHQVMAYASGSLEICATFAVDQDGKPIFIVPALHKFGLVGKFKLEIYATGPFQIDRVPGPGF
jgi:hypothetical protein